MKKISILALTALLLNIGYSIELSNLEISSVEISNFRNLSQQQLLDTANYHFKKNDVDLALLCYGLIVKTPEKSNYEQQVRVVSALNRTGVLYMNMSDYRNAYKNFIDGLFFCEEYNISFEKSNIYNNLGNIYYHFKKPDIAKSYYNRALILCEDTAKAYIYYNNLGIVLSESGEIDSAFKLLNTSLQICKQYNNHLSVVSNSIASLYQRIKQYDSAYYYYKLSLKESRQNNLVQYEIQGLSDLGKLFFETNETDSALFYINLSNTLAEENNFLRIMAENQLILSKVEESKGKTETAFEYYKEYANLRDSVFNASIFGDINQLQRMYELSKTNQQIEKLVIKQRIRERTIFIILCVLILVSVGLLYIYLQNKKLNKAYKILFQKNLEIINLQEKNFQENLSEKHHNNDSDKSKDSIHNTQYELFNKILLMMEDSELICDTAFSIDKLASMVQSNRTYVSQVINNLTNKNFRSFLNIYRIREAQRIFSGPDISKYTIESVALMVGFKSRSSFYNVFKDITGVSPNFYLKSMQKQYET